MASATTGISSGLTTEQVIDLIFRDPAVKHGLSEFDDLGKKPHQVLNIYAKAVESGRAKGEVRYYLKCFKRGIDIQVYSERKSNPEEIVRQLWLYKLHHVYHYPWDHIEVEKDIDFGTITFDKAADIFVYQRDGKTAKIVLEMKRPDRKDGLNQLKSYLNAEGSPVIATVPTNSPCQLATSRLLLCLAIQSRAERNILWLLEERAHQPLLAKTRRRSRSKFARPYICRFIRFRRFTCPSVWPLFQGSESEAFTAARSGLRPAANRRISAGAPTSTDLAIQSSRSLAHRSVTNC